MINLSDKEWTQLQIENEVEDALIAYDPSTGAEVAAVAAQVTAVAAQNTAIAAQVTVVDGVVDLIPSSTGALSWNATALAAIEKEANDALVDEGLDHLTAVADATLASVIDDSVLAHILAIDGDVSDFDDNTDSLEAIRGKADLIQHDSAKNLSTIETELDAVLDLARAGDSGTTTLDGSEQTLYEETDTTAFVLQDFCIDLTNQAAGDTVVVRIYKKIKSGGSYVKIVEDTYAGVQDPLGQNYIGPWGSTYGVKVTIEHTVVAGAFDVDAEFNDAKAGG